MKILNFAVFAKPSRNIVNFVNLYKFSAGDVSPGGKSAPQRQKLHTDDVKSERNLVRSLSGRHSSYITLAIVYE